MNKYFQIKKFREIFFVPLIFILFTILQNNSFAQEAKDTNGGYVKVDGAELWYQIKGKGEPVVVIPGGPGDSHLYLTPWFDELAKNFKLIYFDAFGRGKSARAKNQSEYSFQRDVKDLEGLRKALGFKKWSVIGHSYGGMVAQEYALKYPSSVDKLILSNTFYSGEMWQENDDNSNYEIRNQYPEKWKEIMKLRNEGYNSSSPELQKVYNVPGGLLYFYDASNYYKFRHDSLSFNPKVYYQIVGADGDFLIGGDIGKLDFRTQLKNLKMPMLIIAGRFDRVSVPRFAIKYEVYAPQAKFVMFEKSGHNPYIEQHDKYFKLLTDFLKEDK
jgi:proline iminopeptidase